VGDASANSEPAETSPSSRSLLRSESTFSLVGEKEGTTIYSPIPQMCFDSTDLPDPTRRMKRFVLTALLCALSASARAETAVSGFNPRFGTKPTFADEPDYRPANRPRAKFEFMIDASPDIRDDEGPLSDRPRPRPHHDRHKPHR
jgi:hypothetical protein